jgi:hypothetical protein
MINGILVKTNKNKPSRAMLVMSFVTTAGSHAVRMQCSSSVSVENLLCPRIKPLYVTVNKPEQNAPTCCVMLTGGGGVNPY